MINKAAPFNQWQLLIQLLIPAIFMLLLVLVYSLNIFRSQKKLNSRQKLAKAPINLKQSITVVSLSGVTIILFLTSLGLVVNNNNKFASQPNFDVIQPNLQQLDEIVGTFVENSTIFTSFWVESKDNYSQELSLLQHFIESPKITRSFDTVIENIKRIFAELLSAIKEFQNMAFTDSGDLKELFESLYKYRSGNTETVFEDIYQSIENITYDTYIDNSSDYVQVNYTIFNQSFIDVFRRVRAEFGGFGLFDNIFNEETLHFMDYLHENIDSVQFIEIISYFTDKFQGGFFDSLVLKLVASKCDTIEQLLSLILNNNTQGLSFNEFSIIGLEYSKMFIKIIYSILSNLRNPTTNEPFHTLVNQFIDFEMEQVDKNKISTIAYSLNVLIAIVIVLSIILIAFQFSKLRLLSFNVSFAVQIITLVIGIICCALSNYLEYTASQFNNDKIKMLFENTNQVFHDLMKMKDNTIAILDNTQIKQLLGVQDYKFIQFQNISINYSTIQQLQATSIIYVHLNVKYFRDFFTQRYSNGNQWLSLLQLFDNDENQIYQISFDLNFEKIFLNKLSLSELIYINETKILQYLNDQLLSIQRKLDTAKLIIYDSQNIMNIFSNLISTNYEQIQNSMTILIASFKTNINDTLLNFASTLFSTDENFSFTNFENYYKYGYYIPYVFDSYTQNNIPNITKYQEDITFHNIQSINKVFFSWLQLVIMSIDTNIQQNACGNYAGVQMHASNKQKIIMTSDDHCYSIPDGDPFCDYPNLLDQFFALDLKTRFVALSDILQNMDFINPIYQSIAVEQRQQFKYDQCDDTMDKCCNSYWIMLGNHTLSERDEYYLENSSTAQQVNDVSLVLLKQSFSGLYLNMDDIILNRVNDSNNISGVELKWMGFTFEQHMLKLIDLSAIFEEHNYYDVLNIMKESGLKEPIQQLEQLKSLLLLFEQQIQKQLPPLITQVANLGNIPFFQQFLIIFYTNLIDFVITSESTQQSPITSKYYVLIADSYYDTNNQYSQLFNITIFLVLTGVIVSLIALIIITVFATVQIRKMQQKQEKVRKGQFELKKNNARKIDQVKGLNSNEQPKQIRAKQNKLSGVVLGTNKLQGITLRVDSI